MTTTNLALVLLLSLSLVACGGGGSSAASGTDRPSTATTPQATTPPATTPPTQTPPDSSPPATSPPDTTPPPVTDPPTSDPPAPSTPTSTPITGVTFDTATHIRQAIGSDNWPTTWSDDDNQYAVWGDGGGFGGTDSTGRSSFGVARVTGDYNNYVGANRYGGLNGECVSTIIGKGHGAPISIGGVLYVWVTPGANTAGYDSFTLHMSNDKGCTWTALSVSFTRATDTISYGTFVQFGKDNSAALDSYVYTIATVVTNTSSLQIVQKPGKVALLRVPANAIQNRGAYEFYAGKDSAGAPVWSATPGSIAPIYEDPSGVGPFPQMIFVPGLNRLVYTNQHGDGTTTAGTKALLTMAEAPQPWGPWTDFYRDTFFPTLSNSIFQWNFAPKWFRNDGRDFTLIFSGTGTHDSWNTVDGSFTTAP